MHTDVIEYEAGDTPLKGYIACKSNTKQPALLIGHDWSGCGEFVRHKAEQLAESGYVGFAIDMYGAGQTADTTEDKKNLMQPLLDDRSLLLARMQAALETIKSFPQTDPDRIAAIGFCFGGLCALDLARSGATIRGAVGFHAALNSPDNFPTETITAKILVLHGYDDPMVPPQQVLSFTEEMTKAQADWQVHMYGGTMHGFTKPNANNHDMGIVYNPAAAQRSWQALQNFLAEIF